MANVIHDDFMLRMSESIASNFNLENNIMLKSEVRRYIKEAESFEFELEETIEQYLYLKWRYPLFKEQPLSKLILDILNFPDRAEEVKIEELIMHLETENNLSN